MDNAIRRDVTLRQRMNVRRSDQPEHEKRHVYFLSYVFLFFDRTFLFWFQRNFIRLLYNLTGWIGSTDNHTSTSADEEGLPASLPSIGQE